MSGGTITFAETAGSPPNYIFPLYALQYCGANNIGIMDMMYRPLYWFGNNYSPTVDYQDSIGDKPSFSNDDKTVTIHLKHYMWSDGEQVTARDIVFYLNVLKADPAKESCLYSPGQLPDNVSSYKALNNTTFQITFDKTYSQTWITYNQLSLLTPMPLAWDKTSMSSKTPSATSTSAPDLTKAGAAKVYDFLNAQGAKISNWASSPLWSVVDGPWKLQSVTTNGEVALVPNTHYSGSPKPSIAKFVEVPFTSESAMIDQIKAEGPSGLNIAYIPSQDYPLTSSLESEGYDVNRASAYGFNYLVLNLHNPTFGPVFSQLYFRQAFQHLVDQKGWVTTFLHGTAVPSYGPIPPHPRNPLFASVADLPNPYPFSVSAASKLLADNGWKVVPGGTTVCVKPGTAKGDCGAGIKKGQGLAFNLDYVSDSQSVQEEMEDLQSQASKIGIKLELTTHPFSDVVAAAAPCTAGQAQCKWTAENWGAGGYYAPSYYPTGSMFMPGASDQSNYDSPEMNRLIKATMTAQPSQEQAAMTRYVKFAEADLPGVFEPTSIGSFGPSAGTLIDKKIGGYTANVYGSLTPEDWYLTK